MEYKDIVLILVRWLLKLGAGVLATLGISSGAAEEVLMGVLMFVIGVIISVVQRKKDLATPPPVK